VLPGLGGANGCAILIPVTFVMPPVAAVILLSSLYWGALYGGCITSILFNIPGEPWAVVTTFDGYPMAKKGQAGRALTAAFFAHGVGALFGTILLTFFAPIIAAFALMFGPPETFGVMLLTFSAFVGLVGKSPLKTVVATAVGFILAAVGIDIVSGALRLTFGLEPLMGAIVGCWMGFKPGGATPASFMAYGFAKAGAKEDEVGEYGKGHIAGIFAPEAAAHGAGTSALLPMLTLGIPGSPTAAVILAGLMIWGLQPGPMLFKDKPEFVWGLIGSTWVGNVLGFLVVVAFAPLFAAVLRISFSILMPLLIFICVIGAYAVNNRMIDIWYMMLFGVIGWAFKKLDYNMAPMLLALVLGDMAEQTLRQSLIMSQGSLLIFVQPPIALPLVIAAALIAFWPAISALKARLKEGKAPGH
jgi:putative tricarboxylic transport membrane protein